MLGGKRTLAVGAYHGGELSSAHHKKRAAACPRTLESSLYFFLSINIGLLSYLQYRIVQDNPLQIRITRVRRLQYEYDLRRNGIISDTFPGPRLNHNDPRPHQHLGACWRWSPGCDGISDDHTSGPALFIPCQMGTKSSESDESGLAAAAHFDLQ